MDTIALNGWDRLLPKVQEASTWVTRILGKSQKTRPSPDLAGSAQNLTGPGSLFRPWSSADSDSIPRWRSLWETITVGVDLGAHQTHKGATPFRLSAAKS